MIVHYFVLKKVGKRNVKFRRSGTLKLPLLLIQSPLHGLFCQSFADLSQRYRFFNIFLNIIFFGLVIKSSHSTRLQF